MRFISRLNQRLGEAVRDRVILDVASEKFGGPSRVGLATQIVAAFIVTSPYVVAGIGLTLLVVGFPNILALGLGAILLGAAFYLRAQRHRNTLDTLNRYDAPKLFELLDSISADLRAPRIDGIHVLGEFTAYVTEFNKRERIIGIGAPLWLAMAPGERLAILSHEIAHLANNDPARVKLTGAAMRTISSWFELFTPPALIDHDTNTRIVVDDRGIEGKLVAGIFGYMVGSLAFAYERMIYAESQRAEYFADIMAAKVAGAEAMQSSLKKTILEPLAYKALSRLYYDGKKEIAVFEEMAKAVTQPTAADATELYEDAAQSLLSVDNTHPPTRYRLEVVGAAGAPIGTHDPKGVDWSTIDQELSQAFRREERAVRSQILAQ